MRNDRKGTGTATLSMKATWSGPEEKWDSIGINNLANYCLVLQPSEEDRQVRK